MLRPAILVTPLLVLCAGCEKDSGSRDVPRFQGVTAAAAVTFTSSPSRCAISFLYDSFHLEWLSNEPAGRSGDRKTASRYIELAVAPGAQGKPIQIHLRGAVAGGAAIRLNLRVGEQSYAVPLPRSTDVQDFYHSDEAQLTRAGVTPIFIEAEATRPNPPDQQVLFTIDSIDIAMPAENGCKSVDDEKQLMPRLRTAGEIIRNFAAAPAAGFVSEDSQ